jgi:signal transduction histidine kinase
MAAAARSRQVAQLCHEMRNPLNGAIGSLSLLQASAPTCRVWSLVNRPVLNAGVFYCKRPILLCAHRATAAPAPAPTQASLPSAGEHVETIGTATLCCTQLRRTLDDIVDFDRIASVRLSRRAPCGFRRFPRAR